MELNFNDNAGLSYTQWNVLPYDDGSNKIVVNIPGSDYIILYKKYYNNIFTTQIERNEEDYQTWLNVSDQFTEVPAKFYPENPVIVNMVDSMGNGYNISNPIPVTDTNYRGKWIARHLILNGEEPYTFIKGSMNIDGSGTTKYFWRSPPSGKTWDIYKMKITIEDSSINHTKFGGISGGLDNGLLLKVTESGIERDLYEHGFKKNGTFYHLSESSMIDAATTDILSVSIDFENNGSAIRLFGSTGDNIKAVVQDDLARLIFMEITIFGYEVDG